LRREPRFQTSSFVAQPTWPRGFHLTSPALVKALLALAVTRVPALARRGLEFVLEAAS